MRRSIVNFLGYAGAVTCLLLIITQFTVGQRVSLPDAQVGSKYLSVIGVEGGLPPLTWSAQGGEIPPGLHLNKVGEIEGVAKVARRAPYSFELKVTDSSQPPQKAVRSFLIRVTAAPLRITGVPKRNDLRIVGVQAKETSAETSGIQGSPGRGELPPTQSPAISGLADREPPAAPAADHATVVSNPQRASSQAVVVPPDPPMTDPDPPAAAPQQPAAPPQSPAAPAAAAPQQSPAPAQAPAAPAAAPQQSPAPAQAPVAPAAAPEQAAAPPQNTASKSKCNGQFSISPSEARIAPGGTLRFTATPADSSCSLPMLKWEKVEPFFGDPLMLQDHGNFADLTWVINDTDIVSAIEDDPGKAYLHITAMADADEGGQVGETLVVLTPQPGGNIVIPVIGFEQAGASAAQSAQKFFFNFFISRPLPFGDTGSNPFGTRYHWFGSVRIASYPQQINSGVGEFATGFAAQVAQLKVNQIAQAGEFTAGLDVRFKALTGGLYPIDSSSGSEHALLSVVAGFGAVSPLNPVESLQLFVTPPVGSAQRPLFLQQFPSSANFAYTGFVTPDRGRFFWEYGAGLRLTNLFFDKSRLQAGAPAMLTYTLGQNQMVSGGVSSGIIQRIEGFFPLPLGERFSKDVSTLYLFGRADMRLAAPRQVTPFILQPAPSGVNGYDPTVNIIPVRSNRDLYTIGVGVDAVKLIKAISLQNKTTSTKSSTSETTPAAAQ